MNVFYTVMYCILAAEGLALVIIVEHKKYATWSEILMITLALLFFPIHMFRLIRNAWRNR